MSYHWEAAKETVLPDGSKTIVVPVSIKNVQLDYKGSTFLYLYKIEQNKYDAALFEIIPSKEYEEELSVINLDTFNGYILKWDLVEGFIKGNKFVSGQEGREVVDTDNPKSASSIFSKKGPIELDEVVVTAPGPGNPSGIPTGSTVVIGGGPASNYFSYVSGGGGDGAPTAATRAQVAKAIQKKIDGSKLDPCVKAILDKLKTLTQNDIASIFRKLGGDSDIYVLSIEFGEVEGNDVAGTKQTSYNCYTTVLDNDFVYGLNGTSKNTPPTDLAIAAVMIHEMVHVYFFSVFDDKVNSGMAHALDNYDILYQKYVNNTYIDKGQDNAQHAQIWKSYINIMSSALEEYATGNITDTPNQFYQDIIMGTLMRTKTFDDKFPDGSEGKRRIINNYISEKNGESNDPNYQPKGKRCK
ncbi:hypothetical protein [Flavobacterium chungbukense]|uniref:hypothetical protein n=1 Tax=Flavobacterium chungbukense TaxID=877464 RepID=UPI001E2B26EF|nr:hypothetical protein [Flavobacterium chungbukense]MCC4922677.1 hypothetical protein [Flavobacterium chungbukense]